MKKDEMQEAECCCKTQKDRYVLIFVSLINMIIFKEMTSEVERNI
ncbi:hypothetical protein PPL_06584 [Heterostelium album PN500]|uniref:Uncharacterized protein n=1 Tax=Heterostelium pallidum (strain ATCC 26659 / Pp 5 / PN500) TaxID=670386 RepID=D3BF51_HETP5|nr:hypothetical protein PPL_06584 [Heterostelium album PN500]EFA79765.1 hypothetical protein PPL_06584 [Heterostelium album PN500]|eukprot:XP_020431886.1 hypothetical protein PPL_06584 [Heterostelium album PN500]